MNREGSRRSTPESWADVQQELYEGAWVPDINRYRPAYAYRGLSLKEWDLKTRLMRLGHDEADLFQVEKGLLRNFTKYAKDQALSDTSFWKRLSVGQHHGLPTRLLDWTYSPFAALHFATEDIDRANRDGVVWRVNINEVHSKLPVQLKKYVDDGGNKEGGAHIFTTEMLENEAGSLEEFESIFEREESKCPVFFEPPSLDDRIVNQYALFAVFPDPNRSIDDWLTEHENCFKKVIIPSDLKMEIRDKLDNANITERMLFPGLDGLAEWLERYYRPIDEDLTGPPE